MSPTPLNPVMTEITTNVKNKGQLKINRESHFIKKPSSSSSQQRQPVIIYTHSPRIIQTNPRDFMELVQKLTGLSRSQQEEQVVAKPKLMACCKEENKSNMAVVSEVGALPLMEDPPIVVPNHVRGSLLPMFDVHDSAELVCSNNGLLAYSDPLLF